MIKYSGFDVIESYKKKKMEIYADSQKSYKIAKSKFVEMKGNIVKKLVITKKNSYF